MRIYKVSGEKIRIKIIVTPNGITAKGINPDGSDAPLNPAHLKAIQNCIPSDNRKTVIEHEPEPELQQEIQDVYMDQGNLMTM